MSRRSKNNTSTVILGIGFAILALILLFKNNGSSTESVGQCTDGRVQEDKRCSLLYGYESVAIVAGNTQNSPLPEIRSQKAKQIIGDAYWASDRQFEVPIVSVSGSQFISAPRLESPARNVTASNERFDKDIKKINDRLALAPSGDGADYLAAIIAAARSMDSTKKSAIIVIGSGYSDTGLLDFAHRNILDSYNTETIKQLLSYDSRLNQDILSGIDIYWQDIGATVSPQVKLDSWTDKTEEIYKTALEYLGAGSMSLSRNANFLFSAQLPDYSVETNYTVNVTNPTELVFEPQLLFLNEQVAEFHPNLATLKNEAAVTDWLKEHIAEPYRVSSNKPTLQITGYLAYQTNDDDNLAYRRADTIKRILVGLGVPEQKIVTSGVNGPYDNSKSQAENRTVVVEVEK